MPQGQGLGAKEKRGVCFRASLEIVLKGSAREMSAKQYSSCKQSGQTARAEKREGKRKRNKEGGEEERERERRKEREEKETRGGRETPSSLAPSVAAPPCKLSQPLATEHAPIKT